MPSISLMLTTIIIICYYSLLHLMIIKMMILIIISIGGRLLKTAAKSLVVMGLIMFAFSAECDWRHASISILLQWVLAIPIVAAKFTSCNWPLCELFAHTTNILFSHTKSSSVWIILRPWSDYFDMHREL